MISNEPMNRIIRFCYLKKQEEDYTFGLYKIITRHYSYLGSTDVKYPPNVGRGLSAADIEVEKLYEPKQNKKIVRIFTVILYMFSVSLGAILLSLYYVFLWKNPHTKGVDQRVRF